METLIDLIVLFLASLHTPPLSLGFFSSLLRKFFPILVGLVRIGYYVLIENTNFGSFE